jgi:hypothetical protein
MQSMIEVIDPVRGVVVASVRLTEYVHGLLGSGLAYTWETDEWDVGRFAIWRLEVGPPDEAAAAPGGWGAALVLAGLLVAGGGALAVMRARGGSAAT